MNISVSDKLIYLAAGCGIGAILGVLFAPRSGEQLRHDLSGKVDEVASKVRERVQLSHLGETTSQTLHNVVERGKNVASIGRQRLNESIEAGKRRFNESIEDDDLAER